MTFPWPSGDAPPPADLDDRSQSAPTFRIQGGPGIGSIGIRGATVVLERALLLRRQRLEDLAEAGLVAQRDEASILLQERAVAEPLLERAAEQRERTRAALRRDRGALLAVEHGRFCRIDRAGRREPGGEGELDRRLRALERLERTFASLTEEHREVITLAHLVGLSRQEIAKQTGWSEVAVRSLLYSEMARFAGALRETL